MLTAADIMTENPLTFALDTDITEAAKVLLERNINGAPVLDEAGEIKGVLCQSDLVAQQKKVELPSVFTLLDGFIPLSSTDTFERELVKIAATKVEQAMTPDPTCIKPETPVEDIATIMAEKKLYTLPVVKGKRLVGVVGKEDVLRSAFSGTRA